ncbi:MAG TPA: ribonuclease HIII [Verrucomicrobiales bacterium]|nr:ribonuclease HIII [Verrucomicrobiales bacterium]
MGLTTYTQEIEEGDVEKLRELLKRGGFEMLAKPYAYYGARKGKLNVTVYEKGPKVLIQGKDTEEFVKFILEPEILGEARLGYEEVHNPEMFQPHFGIDESGKGDYFGPLVIAGAYTDSESTRALMEAGVMDSKRVSSRDRIVNLSGIIRRTQGVKVSVIMVGPKRYNELYERFANLNELLAWGHAKVIKELSELVPGCPRALSDQFANPRVLERALARQEVNVKLQQRTKGESDVAVAAASILAREAFVRWIENASETWGLALPLGAGAPVLASGREFIALHGRERLAEIAKFHFKTTNQLTRTENE